MVLLLSVSSDYLLSGLFWVFGSGRAWIFGLGRKSGTKISRNGLDGVRQGYTDCFWLLGNAGFKGWEDMALEGRGLEGKYGASDKIGPSMLQKEI